MFSVRYAESAQELQVVLNTLEEDGFVVRQIGSHVFPPEHSLRGGVIAWSGNVTYTVIAYQMQDSRFEMVEQLTQAVDALREAVDRLEEDD